MESFKNEKTVIMEAVSLQLFIVGTSGSVREGVRQKMVENSKRR